MKTGYKIAIISGITAAAVMLITYRVRAASIARSWVGISEKGANESFSSTAFQNMMKSIGWKSGEEWCMYFAKAVHYDTFKKDRAHISKILDGSTQRSFMSAKNDTTGTYKVITSGRPKIGDIAIWQKTTDPSKGHAGVVIKSGSDSFTTVEGNTNLAGSASGEKVLVKERPLTYDKAIPNSTLKLRGFIRKRMDWF